MESIEDKINTINQLYLNLKHKHHKALNDAEEAFDKIKISLDHNIYCSQILENQIKVFKELRRQVSEAEKTSDNYQVLNMSAIKERYLLEDVLKKYVNTEICKLDYSLTFDGNFYLDDSVDERIGINLEPEESFT
jgi:hypothetical protein